MRNAFTVSIVGHVAALLAAVVTLPSAESAAERFEAITLPVDLVTLADFTELTRGVEAGAPDAAPAAAPEPTTAAVPVPRPEPTPTPAPEPTPAPAPEPTPAPEPAPVAAAPEPTPALAPEPTPAPAAEPAPAPAPVVVAAAEPAPAPAPTPEPAPAPAPAQPAMQPTIGAVPRARPARPEPTPPTPEPTPTPPPTQTAAATPTPTPAPAAPAQRPTPPAPATPTPVATVPTPPAPTPEPVLPVVEAPTTAPTLDEILNAALANANAAAAQPAPAQQPLGVANGAATAAMTQSQRDALVGMIRTAVARCWNPPPGWTTPAEVRVVLQFRLNRDGTVQGIPQIIEAPGGRYAQAAPDSAQRAVYVCAPYQLPADQYEGPDGWQEVRMIFDPIEMF